MTTTDMTVANTIREQLGRKALFMIGAKDLVGSENSLSFRIGRNEKGVTHIRIVLDPSDTYTLTFLRVRGLSVKEVSSISFVYADQLRSTIETNTGLYTSL